jgi:hypothetical protein
MPNAFSGWFIHIWPVDTAVVADPLRNQLVVPGLADAECLHRVRLHVGDHLGRRDGDEIDILVGIDAGGRQPVADPHVMGAAREGHRHVDLVAARLALGDDGFHLGGVEIGLGGEISLFDRDRLAVDVQARKDVHRHLAGDAERQQIGHWREDMRAVDAATARAEHEIVAGRAPARLLGDGDIGHAIFGEQPHFLRHDQRRGIGEGDEAELRALDLRPRSRRERAAGQRHMGGLEQCSSGCGPADLQKSTTLQRRRSNLGDVFFIVVSHCETPFSQPRKKPPRNGVPRVEWRLCLPSADGEGVPHRVHP